MNGIGLWMALERCMAKRGGLLGEAPWYVFDLAEESKEHLYFTHNDIVRRTDCHSDTRLGFDTPSGAPQIRRGTLHIGGIRIGSARARSGVDSAPVTLVT
jgi:hypothetical protein